MWPWGKAARIRKEEKLREQLGMSAKSKNLHEAARQLRRQEELAKLDALTRKLERKVAAIPAVMNCPACNRTFVPGEHEWQRMRLSDGREVTRCIDDRGVVHNTGRNGTIRYMNEPVSEEDLEYVRRSILGEDTA